jgi:hypothetical protein
MSVNNFIEAGFTLLLQTQLLDWSDTIVPAVPFRNLLRETAYERKVRPPCRLRSAPSEEVNLSVLSLSFFLFS